MDEALLVGGLLLLVELTGLETGADPLLGLEGMLGLPGDPPPPPPPPPLLLEGPRDPGGPSPEGGRAPIPLPGPTLSVII